MCFCNCCFYFNNAIFVVINYLLSAFRFYLLKIYFDQFTYACTDTQVSVANKLRIYSFTLKYEIEILN